MAVLLENPVPKPKFPQSQASKEASAKARATIRRTLQQAADLQQLAFESACAIKAAVSPEELELAQARAKAVYDATKSWDISVDRVRIVRNKPMPGSLRPEAKSKRSKAKQPTFLEQMPE